jgi:hypothetical protein
MDGGDYDQVGDQRFLNAVFSEHWQRMDSTETASAHPLVLPVSKYTTR